MSQKLTAHASIETDNQYTEFERMVADRVATAKEPLFTRECPYIFEAYLSGIPLSKRQHYNCVACKKFLEKYGTLASIDEEGVARSFLWYDLDPPPFFANSVIKMIEAVLRVTGVFVNDAATWGTPRTKDWTHLSGIPSIPVHTSPLTTASQLAAAKKEEFIMLKRGLSELNPGLAGKALAILKSETLQRSEKAISIAQWLVDLFDRLEGVKGHYYDSLVWLAVATAPPGFAHIRSTMIATLFDDLLAGIDMPEVQRRWAAKMHPLQYQRPTAAPTEGAIKAAEEMVEKMGVAGSLERRFARREECTAIWKPSVQEPKPSGGGVFDHLKPGNVSEPLQITGDKMTWEKFCAKVLPEALEIEIMPPAHGSYYGLVTAANPDSPPILQWDFPEKRNPVSWYFYFGGSRAPDWNISPHQWLKLDAILLSPPHWHNADLFKHQKEMALLVLPGAKDLRHEAGGGLFPENIRSEYHGIRSVIEAYTLKAKIKDKDAGNANGYALQKGQTWDLRVRVKLKDSVTTYILDRWD